MQSILNTVRNLDLFAVPVSLSYKGKTSFNTLSGGCLSLVIILTFITYAGLSLHHLIVHPVLWGRTEYEIVSSEANTDAFNITTQTSSVAI